MITTMNEKLLTFCDELKAFMAKHKIDTMKSLRNYFMSKSDELTTEEK